MKLRKIIATGIAATAFLAFSAGTAQAGHAQADATLGLNGANEVTQAGGDRNGSGNIDITVYGPGPDNGTTVAFPGKYYLCYDLVTRNIDDATAAHIHEVDREGNEKTNPRKLAGPVVVNLLLGADDDTEGAAFKDDDGQLVDADEATSTCVTAEDDEVIDELTHHPAEYYVNVHNDEFPGGAIRGQLHAFN